MVCTSSCRACPATSCCASLPAAGPSRAASGCAWRSSGLKPRQVVAEFAHHLDEELDLMREAANASQLRRNFAYSPLLAVPEVHWDLCSERVMTMERMHGVPVSHIAVLKERGIDLKALARAGVEICFTQVFRDGFFHADMHPGNILVATEGEHAAAAPAPRASRARRRSHRCLARNCRTPHSGARAAQSAARRPARRRAG